MTAAVLVPDVDHLLLRISRQEALEADPAYWLRRGRAFALADSPEVAAACRSRAAVLLGWPDTRIETSPDDRLAYLDAFEVAALQDGTS
jgi:hypothetical protein